MSGKHTIGWIGMGRMGYPMAERLLKAGNAVSIWNRTRAKAEPLAKLGGRVVDKPADLVGSDLVFIMVSTGKDLEQVCFGPGGVAAGGKGKAPKVIVDCSSISVEESAACRSKLAAIGTDFLAAPVSGNGKVVKAGKLSAVASGPKSAFDLAKPYMLSFAPRGVSYVGEGELSRICKIAHNVMLGVVIQNLAEITILAEKAGVPRHAFLEFINNGAMGSMFTRYKANAIVNLDWTTTFTPELLRKDLGPRPRSRPQAEHADAGDGGDTGGAASPLRRGAAATRSQGLSREGFRRHAGNGGAHRGHQAQGRERARSVRPGDGRLMVRGRLRHHRTTAASAALRRSAGR